MNVKRKPAVDIADQIWTCYARSIDGDHNWPPVGKTYGYGHYQTPLNRALTALALACKHARRSALTAIAAHPEASATLARVDERSRWEETDFVFSGDYGAGLLRVSTQCVTSRLCIDGDRLDTPLWQLVMPMGRELRGQMGDHAEWLDYNDIVRHHLNLLFSEAAAWDRMIRSRIVTCRAPAPLRPALEEA